jgi:hypothetical protein
VWLRLIKAIALDKLGSIRRLGRSKTRLTASGAPRRGAPDGKQLAEF